MAFSFNSLQSTISSWYWAATDLVAPPCCVGCGKTGARWCASCARKTAKILERVCSVCGLSPVGETCPHCAEYPTDFQRARSFAFYQAPFRHLVIHLKHHQDRALGDQLAAWIAPVAEQIAPPGGLAVPVPLSERRRATRGYNQVDLFAKPLAFTLGLDYQAGALLRVRDTRSQVGLTAPERTRNLLRAFSAREEMVRDRDVLLLDDVFTTGTTANACVRALKAAGVRSVSVFTLARAQQNNQ